jgi:hypothetical protein
VLLERVALPDPELVAEGEAVADGLLLPLAELLADALGVDDGKRPDSEALGLILGESELLSKAVPAKGVAVLD